MALHYNNLDLAVFNLCLSNLHDMNIFQLSRTWAGGQFPRCYRATPALFRGLPSFNPFLILGCHNGDENKKRRLRFLLGSPLTVHISRCRMTSWNEELIRVTWDFNEVSAPTTTDRKLSFASSVLAGVQTTRHNPGTSLKGSLESCWR